LAVTADGTCVATGTAGDALTALGGSLHLWDRTRGKRTQTIRTQATPCALAFLPDDETLVAGFTDGKIVLYDRDANRVGEFSAPSSGDQLLRSASAAHTDRIRAVVPSADGNILFSLSDGPSDLDPGVLKRWSLADRSPIHTVRVKTRPFSMIPNADGTLLAISAFGGTAEVWSAR